MFLYKFFDYKFNIQGFSSDLFSIPHIIYIILGVILAILIGIFSRKINKDKLTLFLKILSIFVLCFEIVKITWESYYDIKTGQGFNKAGILPVYTCSLFIYTLLLSSFTKGKVREYSLSFLSTICLLSGFIGMIYCNGLNWYPFWTFGAFYSLFFHLSMFLVGVLLITSGYVKLEWRDIYRGWIPMLFLAFIAFPINYEYGGDYMLLYEAGGVPLYDKLAQFMAAHSLRWLFGMFMLVSYMILSTLVISIYKLVLYFINKKKANKANE